MESKINLRREGRGFALLLEISRSRCGADANEIAVPGLACARGHGSSGGAAAWNGGGDGCAGFAASDVAGPDETAPSTESEDCGVFGALDRAFFMSVPLRLEN